MSKKRKDFTPRNDEGYDKKYFLKPEIYTIDEITKHIRSDESYVELNGTRVKVIGLRLNTFTKYTKCVNCSREGTHFRIASNNDSKKGPHSFHLTLWSEDKVQMTKDHIIPSSKGGADHMSNMQCMCTKCNQKKGNTVTDKDVENGSYVENYDPKNYLKNGEEDER